MCQAISALSATSQVQVATIIQPGIYPLPVVGNPDQTINFEVTQTSVSHTYSIEVGSLDRYAEVICFTLPVYGSSFEEIQVLPNQGIEKSFYDTYQLILDVQSIGSRGGSNTELINTAPGTFIVKARDVSYLLEAVKEISEHSTALAEKLVESYMSYMNLNQSSPVTKLPILVYLQDTTVSSEQVNRCFVSYLVPQNGLITYPSTENDHEALEVPEVIKMDCLFIWGTNVVEPTTNVITFQDLSNYTANTSANSALLSGDESTSWLMPQYILGFVEINDNIYNGFITVNPINEIDTLANQKDYNCIDNVQLNSSGF